MWSVEFTDVPFEADVRELMMAFYPEIRDTDKASPSVSCKGHRENDNYILEIVFPDGEYSRFSSRILANRFDTKCEIKRRVYTALSEHEGYELPWGTLTGIRPTKLMLNGLEAGYEKEELEASFRKDYFTSDKKTELCYDIAEREYNVLRDINYKKGWSLYVGIPFCPTRCLYCSFTAYPVGLWADRKSLYIESLKKEIHAVSERMKTSGLELQTVYMGGGTPTSLEAEELEELLNCIIGCNDMSRVREFTVEAGRPDSITAEKLKVMKNAGVGRISINPQTMNQKTLDIIGRRHTVDEVREKFLLARSAGFENINMDIIIGLPGETAAEVEQTMAALRELGPDDITVHSLALKRAARLNEEKYRYDYASPDEISRMARIAEKTCLDMNLTPYYLYRQKNMAGNFENVGYCRKGCEGVYNILIMEEKQPIIGCGAGTTTRLPVKEGGVFRIENVKDPQVYIDRIDETIARKRDMELWH